MLVVNMLNEGLHIKTVDSVMFLRNTKSNVIYLQQMGRCLDNGIDRIPTVIDLVGNIDNAGVGYNTLTLAKELDELEKEKITSGQQKVSEKKDI